ncbi:MAG TPA: hypothetical protein VL443_24795 [Cyclobacteriaceae bacterium]|jgi:hypothetical protein|nr:hypothetical protein [Cyclobacteriaceae bacterium]
MKNIYKIIFALSFMMVSIISKAQENKVEMADTFRADGKIYVVVAIVLIILVGFVVYLISLDRKITKLEKLVQQKDPKTK